MMTENIESKKSLLDQVFDEMFEIINKQKEFDAETIENLKKLSCSGDLKKAPQVINVIKSIEKEIS